MKLSTWTRFDVTTQIPPDWRSTYADALTQNAAREFPPGSATGGVRHGWCLPDDLLGVDFADTNAWLFNQYVAVGLRVDTKKIPAAVLRAHLEARKREWCARNNRERCPPSVREEIRETLVNELLTQVMPTLRSVPVVWNVADGYVLVGTHAEGHVEAARKLFFRTFGLTLREHMPVAELDEASVEALTGHPRDEDPSVSSDVMAEFLRWLWERDARGNATIPVDDGDVSWFVDERIGLAPTAGEAVRHTIRAYSSDGPATLAAVGSGEFIGVLQLCIRRDEREYTVTLTPALQPRSVKLPIAVKVGDAAEVLYDRMFCVEELHFLIGAMWRAFVELRISDRWGQAMGSARAWLSEEVARVFEVDEATGQTKLFGVRA